MVAIDDSHSMAKYGCKQLAVEAMCVISNALALLEVGEISVVSFGTECRLLHPFGQQFTAHAGANVLKEFTFAQPHSHIGLLLKNAYALFQDAKQRFRQTPGLKVNQLLFVVSDTDQIHQEGTQLVERWVREVQDAGVFLVFVIIDSPEKEHSVLDQLTAIFHNGELKMDRYMDRFVDKHYIVLRDITALPVQLSDALRQWFELVSSD